jgi:hypothetical protein
MLGTDMYIVVLNANQINQISLDELGTLMSHSVISMPTILIEIPSN